MEEIKKQASNIDEEGNVLYLDQERLDRKEVPFPPYKNKPNGLGIYNWLKEHVIYMSDKRWPIAKKLYKMFIKYSVWMKEGGKKAEFYKKGIMIAPDMEAQTSTVVMPLNVDITEEIDLKLQMLNCHESQVVWMRDHDGIDFADMVKTISKYRGYQCGVAYAEAFRQCQVYLKGTTKRLLP